DAPACSPRLLGGEPDRVHRADLHALPAPGTPVRAHDQRAAIGPDRVFRAGEQAGAATLAAADRHGCGHAYPLGVTNRPATSRLALLPTTTTQCMSTVEISSCWSAPTVTRSPGRLASRTIPTGVLSGRCSR